MKVGWSTYIRKLSSKDEYSNLWKEIVLMDPEPLMDLLIQERKKCDYLRCPALIDYAKNIYVIRSPYDFTLKINEENGSIEIDKFDQEWVDENVTGRYINIKNDKIDSVCITITISYLFFCDEDLEIEVLDIPLLTTNLTKNIKMVPGKMNIHRWIRPLDFTFEIQDVSIPLVFKRGDPLFAVKFNSVGDVNLVHLPFTDEMYKTIRACLDSRNYIPKKSLKQRYDMAKRFLSKKKWLSKS